MGLRIGLFGSGRGVLRFVALFLLFATVAIVRVEYERPLAGVKTPRAIKSFHFIDEIFRRAKA